MKFIECPLCGSKSIKKKRGIYNFKVRNKIIPSPIIDYWECPGCGEAFFDQEANKKIDAALLFDKKRKVEKEMQLMI